MEKPTWINIMGIPFEIKYPKKMSKDVLGETRGTSREILIKPELQGEVFEATLLHEIVHAVLYVSGIAELFETEKEEEAIVVALEHGLSQLYERKAKIILDKPI